MWWNINECDEYFYFYFIVSFSITVANTPWIFLNFPSFIFPFFQLRKGTVFVWWDVGAILSTLISISDGLGPSIFRGKIKATRPTREEMDGKVFFPPELAFQPLMLYFVRVLLHICTLTWRANNYVFRQDRGINSRNENTKTQVLLIVLTRKMSQFSFSLR